MATMQLGESMSVSLAGSAGARRHRSEGGFTLLEIMIVVSIISCLAAIAVPRMLEAQRQAHKTKAIAQMRQLYDAQQRYREKNGTYAPNIAALVAAGLVTSPFKSTFLGIQQVGYYEYQTSIPAVGTAVNPPPNSTVNAQLRFRIGCEPVGTTTNDRLLRGDQMMFMLETGQMYEHKAPACSLNHLSTTLGSESDTQFGSYYNTINIE